jgi:cytochrome c oxidase assembly protein subunit 15
MWVVMTAAGIADGLRRAVKVGLGAGLLCSLLNLLVLGSFLVEQKTDGAPAPGFSGLRPDAYLFVPGFLALGAVVGVLAATIAGRIERTVRGQGVTVEERVASLEASAPGYWLSRFAIVAVVTIAMLLPIGGGVTSTQSGMAVPGWPDSYGANMFLYPISLMTGRVFFEHAHRLLGALAGLTVLTLTVYTLATPASRKARIWAVGLFVLVCVQGWIGGGGRVNLNNAYFGAVHGIVAQLLFAVTVALGAFLSPLYQPGALFSHEARDRRRKALVTAALHSTLVQLALGATFRHLKTTPNPGSMHILYTHAAFSLVVVVAALLAGFALFARPVRDRSADPIGPTIHRLGRGLVGSVTIQFLLGWLAFWFVASAGKTVSPPLADELASAPPIDIPQAVVATLHQANGALLLALTTLGVVWMKRIWRDAVASQAAEAQTAR